MDDTATTESTPLTPTVTWRERLHRPVTGRALRVWRIVLVSWVVADLVGVGVAAGMHVAGWR